MVKYGGALIFNFRDDYLSYGGNLGVYVGMLEKTYISAKQNKTNPKHSTNFCPLDECIFSIGESRLVSGRCILLGWISPRAQFQSWALKGIITFLFWHRWTGKVIWLLERWRNIKVSGGAVRGWPTKFSDFE